MSNLSHRQEKIQAKRKATPWRDFVMEICGREPMCFYKVNALVSKFPKTERIWKIVKQDCFMPHTGIDYRGKFLRDINQLRNISELPAVIHFEKTENAEYADTVYASKNVYMSKVVTFWGENILYSLGVKDNWHNIINWRMIYNSSANIYQCNSVINWFNIFYSRYIIDSSEIWLSSNLIGCDHCIECDNLEHKSFHIHNQPVTKEEYNTYLSHIKYNEQYLYQTYTSINPTGHNIDTTESSWGWLINIHHVQNIYNSININYGRNIIDNWANDISEYFYDTFLSWRGHHFYAIVNSGAFCEHIYCSISIAGSSHIYYSYYLESCSFCLWCIWLKNKSYYILNKQYTKEEWYEKVDEIFWQMEKDRTLWEFFPASMNPFYFNDTAAYLINPSFTKEEVTAKWYLRRDEPIKVDIPEGMEVVKTSELWNYEWRQDPQGHVILNSFQDLDAEINSAWHSRWINPDILKKVIQDEQW